MSLDRASVFPESTLPCSQELIESGNKLAQTVRVGDCSFLREHNAGCEADYKRQAIKDGRLMLHAQIGYRELAKSQVAWAEICDAVAGKGGRVDRYGICLDWSMGYPAAERAGRPQGTGLILKSEDDFAALTGEAPVAPHFGDFVIGMPSALENTIAALRAGSTSIGNLGQYFTFRMPGWHDDVDTTAATVEALALLAAQPVEIIVHSNLDDGFAALFCDMSCAFGAVLIERYIVDELLGGHIGHCYGHTFSDPETRLAFQRALACKPGTAPGTMIYGNTVAYEGTESDNYAALGSYLMVDAVGQRLAGTGHALNPVPITEAERIPDIAEVIDAQLFALRLMERSEGFAPLVDVPRADLVAEQLIEGGEKFRKAVLSGLQQADIDTEDAVELLLALRRIGAKRLEELFGPGAPQADKPRGRQPLVQATSISALEKLAEAKTAALTDSERVAISDGNFTACVCATDVHEYGKMLLEEMLKRLGVRVIDAGVHAEPAAVASVANAEGSDLIAISTYNGVALDYLHSVQNELSRIGAQVPVLIGGRLNRIPDASNTSLPVDISVDIAATGAIVCHKAEDMLEYLLGLAAERMT